MPIKHAALKQLRKDKKRTARNQAAESALRTATKELVTLLRDQKLDDARTLLDRVSAQYDRAVSKRIIHRNTAARFKSRLTRRIARLSAK